MPSLGVDRLLKKKKNYLHKRREKKRERGIHRIRRGGYPVIHDL